MRQIHTDEKNTSARTIYHKLDKTDMDWLIEELHRYQCLMGELRNNTDKSYSNLSKEYWSSKDKSLPKGYNGLNTPESFVSGLLNNLKYGKQYDLSDIQLRALENISKNMNMIYEAVKHLNLQPNTEKLEEISFREKLFG